jgi:diguanylate cyclase (GGDEF)-like protein
MARPLGEEEEEDESLFLAVQRDSEALRTRLVELYLLYFVSKSYNVALDLDSVFASTMRLLRDSLNIEEFCLLLLDEPSAQLRVWEADTAIYHATSDLTFSLGEGITGLAAQTGEAVLVQDTKKDKRFSHYKGRVPDIGSFLSVPLKTERNRVIGVLNIHKREANGFHANDPVFFTAVAEHLAHAIDRGRRYETAQRASMFDDLTGIYNKRAFLNTAHRELSKAARHGEAVSVIITDIDHFKQINDNHGHMVGDRMLTEVARRLCSAVRESDIVARFGGEEFTVLLPSTESTGAAAVAEKIRQAIAQEFASSPGEPDSPAITLTLGVAAYPDDGDTVEDLLTAADRRMYAGKQQGRNCTIAADQPKAQLSGTERRRGERLHSSLHLVREAGQVRAIDLASEEGHWDICSLLEASHCGFSAVVQFQPRVGAVYKCRVQTAFNSSGETLLEVQVVQSRRVGPHRYMVGVDITHPSEQTWARIYNLLNH